MAGAFFLLELLALGAAGLLACAGLIAFGGLARNRMGLLAVGLYALAWGVGLSLLPQLLWPVARGDNAFLGHFLFSLLLAPLGLVLALAGAAGLRRGARPRAAAGCALLLSAVGATAALGFLALRGPGPWQTRPTGAFGAGTFGVDIIAAGIAIGAAVFLIGRRLGASESAPTGR